MNWEDTTLNVTLGEQSPERAILLNIAWQLEGVSVAPLPRIRFGKPLICLPSTSQDTEE